MVPTVSCRLSAVAISLGCGLLLSPAAVLAEAWGVDDPVVSWGIAGLSDWDTAMPFLDIGRLMRPFFAYARDEWESMGHAELVEGGYLDANGYPLSIPPGMEGIRTIWGWSDTTGMEGRKGIYLLTYKGRGTVQVGGPVRTINASPGVITFENPSGGGFWLNITAIDPGDPPRAISVVRADHADLLAAGALFDPGWLSVVADARELRFMDWMNANSARPSETWDIRPVPEDASWTESGAPVEVMVRLANEAGVDPWFTMPHTADAAYVEAFATYVRDNLDPRLKAHVEYSNETWNAAFPQFHWLRDQAIADWGEEVSENWDAIFNYHAKRATEVALIWERVFAGEPPERLVNVLGTHSGHLWLSERQMTAPEWALREPDRFVLPAEVFEELAATTYFGVSLVNDPALREEMTVRAEGMGRGAFSWLFEILSQEGRLEDSIPANLGRLAEQRAQAEGFGLRLVAYEGGQHVHHSFAVEGLTAEAADRLAGILGDFVRSPEMGALYEQLWDGWREIGQGAFMQFVEISLPSRYGSWGLMAYPGDRTMRSTFVLERQAQGGSWWGEGGGPQYLQGVTSEGGESADVMEGTDEEDFLAGRGGDDSFPSSPGSDGIAGGDGRDTYLLPGPADDYQIAPEGEGWRVSGPLGSAYLIGVETVAFADGTTRQLAD